MKAVREYQTQDNQLICLVSYLPDFEDTDDVSNLDGQQITLRAAVLPYPDSVNLPLPLLTCLGGKFTTMMDCLDEVIRFCQTLKQMYQL